MRKIFVIFMIIQVIFFSLLVELCMSNGVVMHKSETNDFQEFTKNFDKLYSSNYEQFWKILKQIEMGAWDCNNYEKTAEFLALANIFTGNVEFIEYRSENFEKLLIEKADCFFESLLLLEYKSRVNVITILRDPVFVEKAQIKEIFKKISEGKYKDISSLYFKN